MISVLAVGQLEIAGVVLGGMGVAVGLLTLLLALRIFTTQSQVGERTTRAVAWLLTPLYGEAIDRRLQKSEVVGEEEWIEIKPEFPSPGLQFEVVLHVYGELETQAYRCTIRTPSNRWLRAEMLVRDALVKAIYPADFDEGPDLEEGPHEVMFSRLDGASAGSSGVFFVMPGPTRIFSVNLRRLVAFWKKD